MDNNERNAIAAQLEDAFLYLGASDLQRSAITANLWPSPTVTLISDDAVLGEFQSGPGKSGLVGKWDAAIIHADGDGCTMAAARSAHWSNVVRRKLGARACHRRQLVQANDFDEFSVLDVWRVNNAGEVTRCHRFPFGYRAGRAALLEKKWPKEWRGERSWIWSTSSMLLGIAAVAPGHWHARVKIEEDVPGLSLITDPTGIKELLKFREVPEGRSRRAALLHWVADHWRQDRFDPETEIYVRRHMRGGRVCQWGEMSVEVLPSLVDNVQAENARIAREFMRRQGEDRRVRHLAPRAG